MSDTPKIVEYWVPIAELQQLERELADLSKQLHHAVGLLSTMPQFENQHPVDILISLKGRSIMSDTPRTDRRVIRQDPRMCGCCYESEITYANFARQLERELAEVTKQRDDLIKELEYIAHSGLSARHLVDHAIASIKAMEGGAQ